MKKLLGFATTFVAISAVVAFTSCSAQTPKADLKTNVDSLSYAMGVYQTTQGLDMYLMQMGVDSAYMVDFVKGLEDGIKFNPEDKKANAHAVGIQLGQMIVQQWIPGMTQQVFGNDSILKIDKTNFVAGFISGATNKDLKMSKEEAQVFSTTKASEIRYGEKKASDLKWLEENKTKEGVQVTASGLQYKVVREGDGPKPTPSNKVKVHYVGTRTDGSEFDSSVKNEEPFEFSVGGGVIQGWIEGIQLMNVGSKYIFYIPYELAYGSQGSPGGIDPFSTLIFEIELLEIVE
ncbi:MAG: FKBP-type peptidyl-prolyl cis-trans isomerase [Dysgonamonadaceae bacterium]|jgi:FKBP-type peptidyl-prolyl cis-trans isomerase FklB|nr:FKBP-type peptidyl-prolyl cis-trans isomerase [Dysgonamonadaceae bacterium]